MTAAFPDPTLIELSTIADGHKYRRHASRETWIPVPLDGTPIPKADIAVPYLILKRLLVAAMATESTDEKLEDAIAWAQREVDKQR
jgi:hypothetical protein